ncbi:hypothetical protein HAX54_028984 [Datura stramonium]|uniref:Uncharacterized protein n=1 Tax=Datura stramonium TaxID=4076 RepID=A0ABS8V7A4_DATST|nr:hypothetical protein [Datura stramonium]
MDRVSPKFLLNEATQASAKRVKSSEMEAFEFKLFEVETVKDKLTQGEKEQTIFKLILHTNSGGPKSYIYKDNNLSSKALDMKKERSQYLEDIAAKTQREPLIKEKHRISY